MTGDDFGLSTETNTGIMRAYLAGALTSTSLMVGGDAAEAAVALAREHPGLAVGLHLTFGDTSPCAPSDQVTMLLSENGRFPADERLLDSAMRSAKGRAQIRTEIAAQFKAYNATGLPFDHVNVHRNVHVRPILAWMVFREATRWGVNAMRVPWDSPKAQFSWVDACRLLRVVALRRLGSLYNLTSPHRSIGREWDAAQLVTVLRGLKAGVSEIYFHPVLDMPGHTFANDLPSLLDDQVKAALRDITLCTYQSAKR